MNQSTSPFRLHIGGVCFVARPEVPVAEISGGEVYDDFDVPPPDGSIDLDVPVRICVDDPPDLRGKAVVFETGQSWSLYRDGEALRFAMVRAGEAEPYCVASLNVSTPSVEIVCTAGMMQDGALPNPLRYPLDQLLLMHTLPSLGGVIVHATGVDVGGQTVVMAGRSGAGKSTIAKQLCDLSGVRVISDDRVILKRAGDEIVVHGTPWPGEGGQALNGVAPLREILFLEHATDNDVSSLTPEEAFECLMPVVSIPWYDETLTTASLELCHRILDTVPAGRFSFRPDATAGSFLVDHVGGV